jgi:biopolymer transport protein ExbD
MAEIIQEEKQKGSKKKPKKFSTHIDMTPMVDLMCLLITFFMLTTAFSKPKAMEITMPEKKNDPNVKAPEISADRTLNILVSGNDQLFYYFGVADPKKPPVPQLIKTNYSKDGIRKVLLQRNKIVFKAVSDLREKVLKGELVLADTTLDRKIRELKKSDKNAPIVLIKADEKAKYKNMVDIIDEMAITTIANYAIVDITPTELQMLGGSPIQAPAK